VTDIGHYIRSRIYIIYAAHLVLLLKSRGITMGCACSRDCGSNKYKLLMEQTLQKQIILKLRWEDKIEIGLKDLSA
jgi:positive regulator of sigma E activity